MKANHNYQFIKPNKVLVRILKVIILSISLAIYATMIGCSGDDGGDGPEPDAQQMFIDKLSGHWTVASATRDGVDVVSDFQGFSVTFTSSGYTTQNGGVAWEGSGSWDFSTPPSSDGSTATVTLDGSISVTLTFSNNDQTLTVTFTINETKFGAGRTKSLAGSYVFVLNR